MLRMIAATAVLLTAVAPAQTTSYTRNNPPPVDGEPNKIVCKKEESIGSRLGAKKVCLTVAEWQARAREDRTQAEKVQSGARLCPDGGGACGQP